MEVNKNIPKRRILVTGGAGFIGGNFIQRILNSSDSIVYNLDKIGYASDKRFVDEKKFVKDYKNKSYFFLNYDLSNEEHVNLALKIANPDWVINFAAESHVDRSIKYPYLFLESNIKGTFNLLQSSKHHWNTLNPERKSKFRFLQISTDEVFGSLGEKGCFDESSRYKPSSPYSASKAASDHLVNAWNETYK